RHVAGPQQLRKQYQRHYLERSEAVPRSRAVHHAGLELIHRRGFEQQRLRMTDRRHFQAPELGAINVAPRKARPMHADEHWGSQPWYESPLEDPETPEVYTYTDAMSYDPGDEVVFRSSATARTWRLQVYRDGLAPEMVLDVDALHGVFAATPQD